MRASFTRTCLLALLSCAVFTACAPAAPDAGRPTADPLTVLTIGTADSGGTMYPVGSAIAKVLTEQNAGIRVNVSASSGSMRNVQGLTSGEIDMGLVSGDVAWAAAHGMDEFPTEQEGLRAVAAVYSSTSNWIAPVASGAVYVHDLQGMRIGVGPQDSTTEISARIAIEAAGLAADGETTLENCSLGSGARQVADGTLDALHGFSGTPIAGLFELAESLPCRILRYTEQELDDILEKNAFYYRAVIPAQTYAGQDEAVKTFGVKCLLCVDASMDSELVYTLTRTLWESRAELGGLHPSMTAMKEDRFPFDAIPIPLHDGAARFYEELAAEGRS